MNTQPFVSVIIPTFNRCAFLIEAIERITHQTYANWELLVVDDGSTDETPNIIERYVHMDRRVRYIRQDNRGVAAARNAGLAHATGELIGFCDSDDLWLPRKLERQVAYLRQHPDVGLVYSDVMSMRGGQVDVPSYFAERLPRAGRVLHALLEQNFIPTSSVLIRKRCLDEIGGFDESLTTSEDYELWLRFCQRFPVGYVPEILVTVRRHADNLTSEHWRGQRAHLLVLDRMKQRFGDQIPPAVLNRAYALTHLQIGYGHLLRGRIRLAREELVRSWRYRPLSGRVYRYLLASLLPVGALAWLVAARRVPGLAHERGAA